MGRNTGDAYESLGGFLCELRLCDGNEEMMHEEHKSLVIEKAEI